MIPDLNGTYLSLARICSSIARHAVNPSLGARRRRPVGDGLEILLQTLANFTSLNKNCLSKCHSTLGRHFHGFGFTASTYYFIASLLLPRYHRHKHGVRVQTRSAKRCL